MDPRYLGTNLTTLFEVQTAGRPRVTESRVDAYYQTHGPSDRRMLPIASTVAGVCLGFVVLGSWLS